MNLNLTEVPTEWAARNASLKDTFAFVERFVPIRDRRVFEIGSDRQFVSAIEMANMGARSVACTNVIDSHDLSRIENSENISFQKIDAASSTFEASSFDVVYGRAILEHIHDPRGIAAEVARLLSPGGMVYLDGGPMWTCRHGHHVWVDTPEGVRYIFPNHDTFEPWEHLQHGAEIMMQRLVDRQIPLDHANLIINHVYHSNDQNRIDPTTIISAFEERNDLDVHAVRVAVGANPPMIEGISEIDLLTGKLIIVARKIESESEKGMVEPYVRAGLPFLNERFISQD